MELRGGTLLTADSSLLANLVRVGPDRLRLLPATVSVAMAAQILGLTERGAREYLTKCVLYGLMERQDGRSNGGRPPSVFCMAPFVVALLDFLESHVRHDLKAIEEYLEVPA